MPATSESRNPSRAKIIALYAKELFLLSIGWTALLALLTSIVQMIARELGF